MAARGDRHPARRLFRWQIRPESERLNLPFRIRVPITTLVLGALALVGFSRWQAAQGAEDTAIIRSADVALALGKAHRIAQAHLKAVAQRQADSAAFYRQRSAMRGQLMAQLDSALRSASSVRDSVPLLLRQIGVMRERLMDDSVAYARLLLARYGDATRADRAEARVASLEANLQATLTVASCHLLGVQWLPSCPSRNLTAVLGLGTGALAVLVLHR